MLQMWEKRSLPGQLQAKEGREGNGQNKECEEVQKLEKVHRLKAEAWTGQPSATVSNLLQGRCRHDVPSYEIGTHEDPQKGKGQQAHLVSVADYTSQCTSS